jgi:predicted metal-dependent peptidase
MAKEYNEPKEFDVSTLTEQAIAEALAEVQSKWHDLGNGIKAKSKLTDKMEEKLTSLVSAAKSGNWKQQLEEAIVQMITYNYSTQESLLWYGHLICQCEIKRDLSMPSPAGVRFMFNKYELFINPLLFGLYTTDEQIAILKHEMLHIINMHIVRQKDREHKKWNFSTDISINQLIKNIPVDGLQPETFKFDKNLNAEQYYELFPIGFGGSGENDDDSENQSNADTSGNGSGNSTGKGDEIVDNNKKLKDMISSALHQVNSGMVGDHSKWQESEGDAEAAKEIARQMADTATQKSRGLMPSECSDAITMLKMQEQVNWKKELRKIVGNRKAFSKLTIKKNDRRFPDRKDLRGKTNDHIADILVVLDVSGSMSDEELLYGLNETRAIAEKAGAAVKIMQVDTEPKLIENFDPKSRNFNRRGCGGTYLYPAIEYVMKNKIRFDAVVLVTDGYIETTWDSKIPRVPFIWLVTQDKNNLALDISTYPRMKSHTLIIEKKK